MAREIWNLLDSKYIKKALGIILPKVKINKKIYIPFLDTEITIDNIDKLPCYRGYREKDKGNNYLNKI